MCILLLLLLEKQAKEKRMQPKLHPLFLALMVNGSPNLLEVSLLDVEHNEAKGQNHHQISRRVIRAHHSHHNGQDRNGQRSQSNKSRQGVYKNGVHIRFSGLRHISESPKAYYAIFEVLLRFDFGLDSRRSIILTLSKSENFSRFSFKYLLAATQMVSQIQTNAFYRISSV